MRLKIQRPFQDKINPKDIQHLVEKTLEMNGVSSPVELGIDITDDKTVHKLNLKYRGIDRTTDVLAFHFHGEGEFVLPPNGVLHLGDVVISCTQAERQAQEQVHSLKDELALLVVHGVLHLLGYDHEEPAQARRMRGKEARVLKSVGLKEQV
ncbi:MAG: rRNA maturation RNase YbeY [Chloroflexi bacterium]|nr:rRNA maturation RNase YbeY [Chloroflexota bacterium]